MDSNSSHDSEELFPINNQYLDPNEVVFHYDDPLLVSGVLRAVVEEDLNKVKYLVESGKSVNINDNCGNTPLHVVVLKNNLEILDYLLSQEDIVVNTRNFKGETPLFQAVRDVRLESTKKLIQAGANVNLPNFEDITPLHVSVTHPDLAEILIVHGAKVDTLDYSGDAPLHDAIVAECLETVCMLLYYNADANSLGGNDLTPFMKALITENIEIQQALFEYVDDFNVASGNNMTTLALALTHETLYVEEIIKRGADINYANSYVEDIPCPFVLCLRVPNSKNFKIIWEKLNYDGVKNSVNFYSLFEHLRQPELERYIEIIAESDNLEVAVESLVKNENFFRFIGKFAENKLDLDLLTRLTCRLILCGYRATTYDIHAIYHNYGYCELFKMLLYMENNYDNGWLPHMIMPRLIFDIDYKLDYLENQLIVAVAISDEELESLLEYFIYPPLINTYLHPHEEIMQKMLMLPRVPSLIELARNKAREYIRQAFKTTNSCQFYTIVNYLNISDVYKRILTFEKKLYRIKDRSKLL